MGAIKTFLKQLWCYHIWEDTEIKDLGKIRVRKSIYYFSYARHACTQKCIKCGAIHIEEYQTILL